MILFPAIDLKDGCCVRLRQGDMEQATVFSDNPAEMAKNFEKAGCEWIHVVDLNGAFAGNSVNGEAIEAILGAVNIPIQLGGGIRTLEDMKYWLDKGVARVILGTIAIKNPELVLKVCKHYGDKIAIGIDARGGQVAVEGWAETSSMHALDLAMMFEGSGAGAIIYTDIDKDGLMEGPNIEMTEVLAQSTSTPIILSGGISSIDDLYGVYELLGPILHGAISGRAIYDGQLDPKEAVEMLKGE
ncbi:MAG: 1-(5-phosphoribosyl)-5-[(5-phosphoribosylamino)methylideneamino]imidazole-4-carboxamide isomerase [Rhodospirillaceae bacterium]|jgi:phosphoribosylformimino-5-aminoimidazole carboxamide ribotide isomerase|nr:1-(5-phosphoribosyl)-5-[(5-phosphoribosylamino)methylideneamino]imidazole-4-carboxamide isomerase [Rhodospirillales bacterium]MBT3904711.1 1-(5-phosphoribosyl)-5-[(5-phosphoribosylamino)methylideneamino]imidazole-4-carboxamide isomerase [Rhodospirillaceae bacterium]MBT4701597.1 1-(5-phosphoribosyl)-5-[(5-phosphoribosylamino)methylideneamino]imidazole-4-carboxamide isomerase [Rhodospirillaceae bacterium]MBT5036245.1 1-(5-phosphoribosyl)-5-[(5-phosphoribosylamino)methylideneamino]imidazole-4-ca